MAKILNDYTIRTKRDTFICSIVLDVDSTEEGYCIELSSADSSSSTSFGRSDLGYQMASALYDALTRCCQQMMNQSFELLQEADQESDDFDLKLESVFWDLVGKHFDSQWVLCDAETGELHTSDEDFMKLIRFIGEWSSIR